MRRLILVFNDIVKLVIALWALFEISLFIFAHSRSGVDQVHDLSSFGLLYGGIFVIINHAILLTSQNWAHINLNF